MSAKKPVKAGLALMALLALVSCGGKESAAEAPAAAEAAMVSEVPDEGAYFTAIGSEPNVVDVVRFIGIADRNVFYNVLEPLTRISGGVVVPAGAESWEVSEDGLVYTFHLRENHWSDGKKVTSYDYANALYRQAEPGNAFAFASDIFCLKGFEEVFKGEAESSELGIETPDEDTLVLYLDEPSPALLSTFDFYPEREDYVEKYGDRLGTDAESVASCGPYSLSGWVHNSELSFVKNEEYWDADNVLLESLTWMVISDTAAQYAAFLSGEIDYLELSDIDNITALERDGSYIEERIPGTRTYMLVLNGNDGLFQNEKVRLAFSLAAGREGIAEDLFNSLMTPAYGLVPPTCSVGSRLYREAAGEPLRELCSEDPVELLKEGLEELGLEPDPSKLTVELSLGSTSASMKLQGEYYQQMFQEALGVTVSLSMNNSTTHLANIRQGKYQMGMASWGADLEPQFQLTRFVGGGQHKKANPVFDELTLSAVVEIDEDERLEKYAAAEKELIQSAMIIPLYYSGIVRFSYPYVRGLWTNEFDNTSFKTVYTSGR